MEDIESPFGNPSELQQREIRPASTLSGAGIRTNGVTSSNTGPQSPGAVESPFEDQATGASVPQSERPGRKPTTSSPSDVDAARSLSNLAASATADQSHEDEDDANEEDALMLHDHATSSTSPRDSGTLEASQASSSMRGRKSKGKGKQKASESGVFSQLWGIGRKVARRVEREREQMGLSHASLRRPASSECVALFDADDDTPGSSDPSKTRPESRGETITQVTAPEHLSPRDRALWMWANIDDLDAFLQEVYAYYLGKGAVCIALTKSLNLVTVAFVIAFSTFLFGCVDYTRIRHDGNLGEIVVPQCFSRFSLLTKVVYLAFGAVFLLHVVRFASSLPRLRVMNHFFEYLLDVPDADIASISWNEVVNRLSRLREEHPITSLEPVETRRASNGGPAAETASQSHRLDAHDVANRIMRQENYLIALFNKDVLDIRVPFSFSRIPLLRRLVGVNESQPVLTRSLEWNLQFCLLDFLFDERGQVRNQFVTERYRKDLIEGLRRRFFFMAIINGIFAPFIIMYLLVYSFLRYFEEYHKDPSTLGSRQYTEFARWKFREFNELPHLFKRRCYRSYPHAQRYINQFPKERTAIIARFVAFVAGSFTAVLLVASLIDPDLFLHFDITSQRNVLFYVGVFGAVTAIARGMIPEEHLVFDPETTLKEVIDHIHYMPSHWRGNFHSAETHAEFGGLYPLKLSIFFSELLSVVLTPFILWLSLPKSAPAIIDFFREFTIHVDGLGYVCSFAVFNFERHGNVQFGAPAHAEDQRMASKEGKMEQSFLGFKATHPDWTPKDPSASLYLTRMADGLTRQSGEPAIKPPRSGPAFTPVNSVLAARSQLYEDAFMRSISLAKGANASALAASAIKTGQRSNRIPALHVVEESQSSLEFEYEDATKPPEATNDGQQAAPSNVQQQAGVRGMLDNMYQGNLGAKW